MKKKLGIFFLLIGLVFVFHNFIIPLPSETPNSHVFEERTFKKNLVYGTEPINLQKSTNVKCDIDGNGKFEPADIASMIMIYEGDVAPSIAKGKLDMDGNGKFEPADIAWAIMLYEDGSNSGGGAIQTPEDEF